MSAEKRIIVALDVPNLDQAKELIETLSPYVGCFKVGLELISSVGGPQAIQFIHQLGGKVFYDGKFNDIPNTIANASIALAMAGVRMFNVHASSGIQGMDSAAVNKGESLVLAVTILTSLEENEAHLIFGTPSKAKVLQFARDALVAGCDGLICSPQELELLGKQKELRRLMLVTPGVRPDWAVTGDQKRVMTPYDAIMAGASALVIGRPITNPPKSIGTPVDVAKDILVSIDQALINRAKAGV